MGLLIEFESLTKSNNENRLLKQAREIIAAYRNKPRKVTAVRPEGENALTEAGNGQGSATHVICRTANTLEIDDGYVFDARGRKVLSTRGRMAAVLARGEL